MQKIRIDFDNPGLPQHISAVENDSQSRFFQATLYENGKAYTAPEGAAYSIMYRGFGPQNQGWYDTINDGAGKRAACAVSGNVVTCEIARQALQVPGHVSIVLCVTTGKGYMLKSWPIECDCKNDRYDSTVEIQIFFYVTQISNESWTQAIQAVEELKNTIDPTLSLSGKAADAKAAGDALKEEAERAKGVESGLKEDLDNITIAINKRNKINPLSSKAGVRWMVNVSENRVMENSQANITALIYEVSKEDNLIITGIGNAQATMPIGCFTSAVPMPESSPVVIESIISKTSWKTETLKVKSPVDGYLLVNVLTEDIESSGVVKQTTINVAHPDNGVFVDNGVYTHFHKVGENKYLCRVFKKCFGNNLLDFYAIYIGSFIDGSLTKNEDIGTNDSDIVGPISVHNGDYQGSWTGGSHTVNIDGTEYPTATNDLVKVVCNTEDVTNTNGYHIGDVEITSVNTLYLPKTITSADLSNATKVIEETRKYILSDTMIVRDSLKFLGDFYVQRYYGCQLITYDMETLELPNNMEQVNIQNRTGMPNYYFENRENRYHCFSKTGRCYDMELKQDGLGSFILYDGTKDDLKFGYLANFFINKIYFGLIGKSILINNGKVLTWEAAYNYYFS